MPDFEFSLHAKDMLVERNISEDWVCERSMNLTRNGWVMTGICITLNTSKKEMAGSLML